jgi:hypothetical protein
MTSQEGGRVKNVPFLKNGAGFSPKKKRIIFCGQKEKISVYIDSRISSFFVWAKIMHKVS